MIAAHDTLEIEEFPRPEGIVEATVCLESGKLASEFCSETSKDIFMEEFPITEICPIHKNGAIPSAGPEAKDTTEEITRF
jgi:penicillin-binding protein 1A